MQLNQRFQPLAKAFFAYPLGLKPRGLRRAEAVFFCQIRKFVEYKAQAEGIAVKLVDERYTSQTCPTCGNRHKPKGRNYRCPSCGFSGHRDQVGQINILSTYKFGEPGKIPVPQRLKHSVPFDIRRTLRCLDIGPITQQDYQ